MSPTIDRPSPNREARPGGRRPDMLILHYTGMRSCEEALERLCDAQARVSAHYLIDEDGTLYRLVDETERAWHAGVSEWEGERDVNSRSIGIELVNPGHEFGYRPFPEPQIERLISLAAQIVGGHAIDPWHVLGHSDVAPLRKTDPGELFPWQRLAAAGVGLWPPQAEPVKAAAEPGMQGRIVRTMQQQLARFGYGVPTQGDYDARTQAVVAAFQRHWRPKTVDGVADGETLSILREVLARKAASPSLT